MVTSCKEQRQKLVEVHEKGIKVAKGSCALALVLGQLNSLLTPKACKGKSVWAGESSILLLLLALEEVGRKVSRFLYALREGGEGEELHRIRCAIMRVGRFLHQSSAGIKFSNVVSAAFFTWHAWDKILVKYDFSNLLPGHQNISPNDIILVGRGESCILLWQGGWASRGDSAGNHVCTPFLPLPRWGQAGDLTDHQRLEQTPKHAATLHRRLMHHLYISTIVSSQYMKGRRVLHLHPFDLTDPNKRAKATFPRRGALTRWRKLGSMGSRGGD
ncbi:hypothetical protein MUK42_22945 [Musa troglodytarum]|uniref:Uncharacterized protein n=1 Tax=Musa troglodytarum TaxID=320322 RepID=A0A9E7GD83_9LILI|nr:hypothetical protein MUK42_22945 [Musa troglodytarum]